MKFFDSCRVIYGKNNFNRFFIAGLINTAIILIGGFVNRYAANGHVHDFIDGFCTAFGGTINIFITAVVIGGAFNVVRRINPGYKYFHSVADGSGHFKRALICANVSGLLLTALYVTAGVIFFRNILMAYMVFAALFIMGWGNITGGAKRVWVRVISIMLIGFVFGFIPGFIGEDALDIPMSIGAALIGAGAAFYIVCLIIALTRADKLWTREE